MAHKDRRISIEQAQGHTMLMTRNELAGYFGRSAQWIGKAVKTGLIPAPIKIPGSASFWNLNTVIEHINSLVAQGKTTNANTTL